MADLLGTDEFLVNRNDVTYTQQQETLMATLQDTDHLLINRAGQTYKITGEDLINSVIDPLAITVILAPDDGYTDTEVTAVPVVSGGKQPDGGYIFSYQWVTATAPDGTDKTSIAGATSATFTPDNAQVGKYLGCVVSTTDALGTSAEGEAYIGPIQVLAQAPVISDVTVSEIYDGANRFTDKEFPYVTTMLIDGEPNPTYEVKAKLSGTTFDFDVKSDAITDVEGGGTITCETELIESVADIETTFTGSTGDWTTNQASIQGGTPFSSTGYSYIYGSFSSREAGYFEIAIPPVYPGNSIEIAWQGHGKDNYRTTQLLLIADDDSVVLTADFDNPSNNQSVPNIVSVGSPTKKATKLKLRIKPGSDPTGIASELIGGFAGILIDGSKLVPGVYTSTVLTFPSAQGFGCFEPGDVVQMPPNLIELDTTKVNKFTNPENAFDNDLDTYAEIAYDGSSAFLHFTIPTGVTTISCIVENTNETEQNLLYMQPGNNTYTNSGTWTETNGFNTSANWIRVPPNSGKVQLTFTLPANVNVARYYPDKPGFRIYATPDAALPPVKIISKDDSDPFTITVDGGDWIGSDGSSGGDIELGWNQTETWSATCGLSDPTKAFDGKTNTFAYTPNGITKHTITTAPFSTRKIIFYKNGSDSTILTQIWVNDTEYQLPQQATAVAYNELDLGAVTEVTKLEVQWQGGQCSFYTISIDSGLLVDAGVPGAPRPTGDTKLVEETPYDTILTLAGSENLDVLTAGTSVKMGLAADVPYQPVSDSIVNVESLVVTNFDAWGNNTTGNVADPNSIDVNALTPRGTNLSVGSPVSPNGNDTARVFRSSNPPDAVGFKIGVDGYTGTQTDHHFYSSPTGTAGSWTFVKRPTRTEVGQGIQINDLYGMMLIDGAYFTSQNYTCTGATALPVLTLSGDTDLAYFREGDVVQAAQLTTAAGFAIATSSTGTDVDYPDTNAGDKVEIYKSADLDMTSTVEQTLPDGIISATRFTHLVFDLIDGTSDFTFSLDATNWRVYSSVNGSDWVSEANVDRPTDLSVRSLFAPSRRTSRYAMISYIPPSYSWKDDYNAKITLNQAYVDAFAAPHQPSQIPGFAENSITIVSIDDTVPSITVDGGEWGTLARNCESDLIESVNETSIKYSDYLTAPGGFSNPATAAFNTANPPDSADGWAAVTAQKTATITFDASSLNLQGEVEVMAASSSALTMKGKGSDTIITKTSSPDYAASTTFVSMGVPDGGLEYITSTMGGNNQSNVYAIKVAGRVLVDDDNLTTLTLSSDKDLGCFKVDDVVQGNPFVQQFSSNIDGTVVTPEKAFNGVIGDYPEILQQQGTASFTLNFDIPISGELEIRGGTLNDNTAITTVATCSDGTVFPIGNSTFTSLEWYGPETVSNVTSIAFTQDTGRGVSLSAIRLDGELLVDGDIVSSSIVSISKEGDSNHPSITVDGGEWYGTDLSGDPDGDTTVTVNAPATPGDTEVTCLSPLKAPTDWTVVESDSTANTLTLSAASVDNSQVWVANDNQAGTDFFVEPSTAMPIQQDHAWGTLQIINNKAQVTGIQKDDPGFLPVTAKDYSIKFPALFPTGNEPDDDLPRGVCVSAIVAAENSEGRSVKESNCFMPADVNPEAAAGPITATTPIQLTLASNANLGEFSPGDNLVMVDENNDISDYTIVSDTINSLDTQSYSQPATYNFKSTRNGAENEHLNPPTVTGIVFLLGKVIFLTILIRLKLQPRRKCSTILTINTVHSSTGKAARFPILVHYGVLMMELAGFLILSLMSSPDPILAKIKPKDLLDIGVGSLH